MFLQGEMVGLDKAHPIPFNPNQGNFIDFVLMDLFSGPYVEARLMYELPFTIHLPCVDYSWNFIDYFIKTMYQQFSK